MKDERLDILSDMITIWASRDNKLSIGLCD